MTHASPDTIRPSPAAPVLRAAATLAWTLAVAYSLAPFDFSLVALRDGAAEASAGAGSGLLDTLLHAAAFLVVGLLDRLGFPGRRTLEAAGAVPLRGLLLCAAFEAGQLFVPSRHSSLLDAFVNISALVLGGWAAQSAASRVRAAAVRPRSRRTRRAALGAWGLAWSALILVPARLVTLDDWDLSFPLIVGNEVGGERPWNGTIEFVGFYDRALEPGDIRALHAAPAGTTRGDARREALGLLAGYDLRPASGPIVRPTGSLAAAPALQVSATPGDERGDSGTPPRLEGSAMARSAAGAASLSRALAAGDAFTVEVWCRPSRASQTGPARIVGISNGPFTRNFTIGHEGRSLEFRVRNWLNGPNGIEHALRSPPVVQAERVHIVAVYARGTSTLFIDGERAGGAVDLRQPSVLLGLGPTGRAAAVAALIAGLSLLLIDAAFPAATSTGTAGLVGRAYALLAPSLALAVFVRPPAGIYLWLAPALIAARFVVNRGRP